MPGSGPSEPKATAHASPDIDALAGRIRAALPGEGISEQRMFGGVCFMLNGNMIAGSSRNGLLVRVGKERREDALRRPGASEMMMGGRAVEGYVFVDPERLDEAGLRDWLDYAHAFVRALPAKPPKSGRKRASKK
ncbi:MAG: TfoX/Sxy family protein [Methylobacteriaceae bacterium]|nr:TfoX/Sxy family protein [Methylobacteriaceae bacterium]